MKNISRKFFIVTTFIMLFVSCAQDVIFYTIDQEIKLKDPTLYNIVYSLLEFDGKLYAANGEVNVKSSATVQTSWSGTSTPGFTVALAVGGNGSDLYALTYSGDEFEEDEKTFYVHHRTASTAWKRIETLGTIDVEDYQAPVIFDDGAGSAFVRKLDDKVYALNGGTVASSPYSDATATVSTSTVKAANLGGVTYFSDSTGFTADGSYLYRVYSGDAQYSSNGIDWKGDVSVSSSGNYTNAAAVYKKSNGTKYLLVGTTSGARAIELNTDGTFDGDTQELVDVDLGVNSVGALNTADTFSGGLYVFGDVIYSATINDDIPDRNGLWSYYPSTGEWNRE